MFPNNCLSLHLKTSTFQVGCGCSKVLQLSISLRQRCVWPMGREENGWCQRWNAHKGLCAALPATTGTWTQEHVRPQGRGQNPKQKSDNTEGPRPPDTLMTQLPYHPWTTRLPSVMYEIRSVWLNHSFGDSMIPMQMYTRAYRDRLCYKGNAN